MCYWRKDIFCAYLKVGVGFTGDDLDPSRQTLREMENVFYEGAFCVLEDTQDASKLMAVIQEFTNSLGGEVVLAVFGWFPPEKRIVKTMEMTAF